MRQHHLKNHFKALISRSVLLSTWSVVGLCFAGDAPAVTPYGSPEDELKTFQIPAGYRLELVASEPVIREPVTLAWDGNGRMFVAQMRTYMQDVDGKNEHDATSCVTMLVDSNGDGKMDQGTVFVDKLSLPRLILPLDGQVLITETNTDQLYSYRDTKRDGVANEKTLLYQGPAIRKGGNLEHQEGGLIWNLDNWIYTSRGTHRIRLTRGSPETELIEHDFGQWGLTQDDVGRMYYSDAGGERPAFGFQMIKAYGNLRLGGELLGNFMEPWPVAPTPDVQGGPGRLRPNNTLNHFTASCGQSIFRGDKLPKDLYGDLLICEPVGRLIRRAKVGNANGKVVLINAYDAEKKEFIASSDPNFRPVHTATGPDGYLYIVDMYRGIIQESAWVGKGSYLRDKVLAAGLEKNVGRGRIWRLVGNEAKPAKPAKSGKSIPGPRMLDETAAQIVEHLSHPNGWWRDTAQKILVLRRDPSVVAALKKKAQSDKEALGRMHALWTLEGMDVIERKLLIEKFADPDSRVRMAAIRISERLLRQGDDALLANLEPLIADPDPNVVAQLVLSVSFSQNKALAAAMINKAKGTKVAQDVFDAYSKNGLARLDGVKETKLSKGAAIYQSLCISCHGQDGKGIDTGTGKIAPSLTGATVSNGNKTIMTKILLRGLTGPLNGKTYLGQIMLPMAQESDEWIADVLTHVRKSWGNTGDAVTPAEVAKVRAATADVKTPYTEKTLLGK